MQKKYLNKIPIYSSNNRLDAGKILQSIINRHTLAAYNFYKFMRGGFIYYFNSFH